MAAKVGGDEEDAGRETADRLFFAAEAEDQALHDVGSVEMRA